jgi:sirohydrochlorin cobaltochelatase
MSAICDFLRRRLANGEWRVGQVLARADFTLRHADDAARSDLEAFTRPEDARELAKYDDAGNYRPLKTAPNLRHGWLLELSSFDDLRLALDFLYPAALGTWVAHEREELAAVPLRETLERQTGMYRVARNITDVQAAEVIRKTCEEGCIRHRLWKTSSIESRESPQRASGEAGPLKIENSRILCAETCSLLVAACRSAVKEHPSSPREGAAPAEP